MNDKDNTLKLLKEKLREINGLDLDDCDELTPNYIQSIKRKDEGFYRWFVFFLMTYLTIDDIPFE